jgi:riboflavin kinase/FMN adenylyltransferase
MQCITQRRFFLSADTVLTVGKFESFHRGHRALINEITQTARERKLASGVVTFWPHPRCYFNESTYKPLFTGEERRHIASGLGLDYWLEYPFDEAFISLSPESFCHILFAELKAKMLVVGEGYRFGYKRAGDVELLNEMAKQYGAEVMAIPKQVYGGELNKSVNTSAIRDLIAAGEMTEAEALLGFPFFIMGMVAKGKQLGRALGFPTVNLPQPADKMLPPDGVYATVTTIDGQTVPGVTNIGLRPTVADDETRTVESFLIDYSGDLYGRSVKTEFFRYIRPEIKFASVGDLIKQIAEDAEKARSYLEDGL